MDFGDSSRHQIRIFWFSMALCVALDLTAGILVACIFTLAAASVSEAVHAFCGRKEIKVLWFRMDVPDIGDLRKSIAEGEVKKHEEVEPRNVDYAVSAILTYYAIKIVALIGIAAYNTI